MFRYDQMETTIDHLEALIALIPEADDDAGPVPTLTEIDPLNPMNKQMLAVTGDHYTYSDMTGGQVKSVIQPQ